MTQPLKVSYPAASTTSVAAAQTSTGTTPLVINGSLLDLAYTSNGGLRRVVLPRIQRVLSLTSTVDLSGINFTFVGEDLNLTAITEVLAGPNNNTVFTTNQFHLVSSITPSASVGTAVSVGTGPAGVTKWKYFDTWVPSPQTVINVNVVSGTVQYTVQYTFDNVAVDATAANVQLISDPLAINQTVDGTYASESPFTASRVSFNSLTTGVADVYFMQSGGGGPR